MGVTRISSLSCGVVAVAALVALSGCGGSSSGKKDDSSTQAATPSATSALPSDIPSGLQQQFLTDETTALKALAVGGAKIKKLPDPTTGAQLKPAVQPMIDATKTFNQQLAALPFPGSASTKVDAVTTANNAWITDATKLTTESSVSKQDMAAALGKDLAQQQAATDQLRGALGLPPL
jgi:hypothetical protein